MLRGTDLHDLFEEFELWRIKNRDSPINKWKHLERFSDEYIPQIKLFIERFLKPYKGIIPESVEGKIYSESQDMVIKWDRIDFDGKRRTIWDYKTGKLYTGKQFTDKFKFELMIYAFIYMLETKKKVDYVGIYFIDHGKALTLEVDNESIQDIIKQIFELKLEMNDYQQNNVWPERYSFTCRWCDFKNKCDSYKRFSKK
jgi:CRISPR/Cas system-associated exonuclease Cas4 (RecB family)